MAVRFRFIGALHRIKDSYLIHNLSASAAYGDWIMSPRITSSWNLPI